MMPAERSTLMLISRRLSALAAQQFEIDLAILKAACGAGE